MIKKSDFMKQCYKAFNSKEFEEICEFPLKNKKIAREKPFNAERFREGAKIFSKWLNDI